MTNENMEPAVLTISVAATRANRATQVRSLQLGLQGIEVTHT